MKKILFAIAFGFIAIAAMTSCGNSNSPEGVVKKQIECLKNKDAEGLVELLNMGELSRKSGDAEKDKAELTSLIQEKAFKSVDEKGGIKSYEILDVDAPKSAEPGSIAFVKVKTVYGNGSENEDRVKVKMDEEGQWKLSMEK